MNEAPLGWLGIARFGLVQAALGAIVVLTTSTLNRVMVVELMLPVIVPAALVALHYVVQVLRPLLGYGSDRGGRRTPWIVGGMALLAAGGTLASVATALMETQRGGGIALAIAAFLMIGLGVGAAGTSLLVLLAKRVSPARRAPAAMVVWLMMILGFAVTATLAGRFLDPYSPARLVLVTAVVALMALLVTAVATWRLEPRGHAAPVVERRVLTSFRQALAQVWSENEARRFAAFVFVAMIAFSAQDLILEPFAGAAFGLTPGQSTQLAGTQHGGILLGMLVVAIVCGAFGGRAFGSLRWWTIAGCLASAVALFLLALAGLIGPPWPLAATVFLLGVANGAFAVTAIGSMMGLVGQGHATREGVRMGLWGAAQAIAFAIGGALGALAADLARIAMGSPGIAYALVFALEGGVFILAAWLAAGVQAGPRAAATTSSSYFVPQVEKG